MEGYDIWKGNVQREVNSGNDTTKKETILAWNCDSK